MTTEHQMRTSPVVSVEQLSLLNSSCSEVLSSGTEKAREEQRNDKMKKTGGVIFRQLHV